MCWDWDIHVLFAVLSQAKLVGLGATILQQSTSWHGSVH